MYSIDETISGMVQWIRKEVIPSLPGYAGWLLGAMVIHHSNNIGELVRSFGSIGQTLDIYNQDGMVDVDHWILDLKQSMKEFCNGNLTIKVAGLNPMTFHENDLDCLKRYIKGEL